MEQIPATLKMDFTRFQLCAPLGVGSDTHFTSQDNMNEDSSRVSELFVSAEEKGIAIIVGMLLLLQFPDSFLGLNNTYIFFRSDP